MKSPRSFVQSRWGLVAVTAILVVAAGNAQQGQREESGASLTEPRIFGNAGQRFRVVPLNGLERPFGFAFLPNGDMLVTEKAGRLRLIRNFTLHPEPIAGIPPVLLTRFQGLWDIALHPRFAENRLVYFTYAKRNNDEVLAPGADPAAKAVLARGRYDGHSLTDVRDIFVSNGWISGPTSARMTFGSDGKVYMTIGVTHRDVEHGGTHRVGTPEEAQNPKSHLGKVLRLNDDGTVPSDNPFVGRPDYMPEIYALGVRNPQGVMVHPDTGELWEAEHGPQGGDEVNVVKPGANLGWPVISYGRAYSGDATLTASGPELPQPCSPGMESPLIVWIPSIAPSGMTYYTGDKFPAWKGSLFVGGLRSAQLQRVTLNRRLLPTGRESLLTELKHRIRDVRQSPDGLLYVLTEGREADRATGKGGMLLRLEPVAEAAN
jgi:glucose/arabinose dehydrogenase